MTKIIEVDIKEEMENSYVDYACEVIEERALPDVRDGMKPVHRRIIFSIYELGLTPEKPHKKSARVVGDVLGKYHPHGDGSVYGAMVRLTQPWLLRYPLLDGHGNFGSIDGDSPASMRYTEIKQQKIFNELIRNINKDSVNFIPNFDGEEREPSVLPSALPNLLINGSSGIAVGIATEIPPNNMNEVVDGIIHQIDNPNCTILDLMQFIKSPDFPTGGSIINPNNMVNVYTKGVGVIIVRSKYHTETVEGKEAIIITEIPYQVNKSNLIDGIYNASKNQKKKDKQGKEKITMAKIPEIDFVRDESDRDGMRIVIALKKKNTFQNTLLKLFKHTDVQKNYNANINALNDKELLEGISLKDMIKYYIEHQKEVITRRSTYDYNKTNERLHIVEGLKIALDSLDLTIKLIRESKSKIESKTKIIKALNIDEIQAEAILEIKLYRLASMEIATFIEEYNQLQDKINKLSNILTNESELLEVLKTELLEIKYIYGDERRTLLTDEQHIEKEVITVEEIEDYNCKLFLTNEHWLKKIQLTSLRNATDHKLKDGDFIKTEISSTNASEIIFLSSLGFAYKVYAHTIENSTTKKLGDFLPSLLQLDKDEKIIGMLSTNYTTPQYVLIVFEDGKAVKIPLTSYMTKQNRSKLANSLSLESPVISIIQISDNTDIYIESNQGKAIVFNTSVLNEKKARNSQGSTIIKSNKEGFAVIKSEVFTDQVIKEDYLVDKASAGKLL